MQGPPVKPQLTSVNGFLQNLFNQMNNTTQKPVLWLVISVFVLMTVAGFWIGNTMVIKPASLENRSLNANDSAKTNTFLLLETDDLSLDEPQLFSIWFVHLNSVDKPKLGFTPVLSVEMVDNDDFPLLKKFSLTSEKQPNREFLSLVAKKGFPSQNYIIIDQKSTAAFVNWFAGKELDNPLELDQHSMAQYGPVLRGFCGSLATVSEKGFVDFPWSKITPDHFSTSLQFTKVIFNLSQLTSPKTPHCEMVPLP